MKKKLIENLKKDNDAVILAHYYVDDDVQEIADYVGDSFYLAETATTLNNKSIIMAGVNFMGESVKILNPEKHVYLVDKNADCPMAHMVTVDKIKDMRENYTDLAVVCYINSTAEIKANSDVCVTSSNAVKIVKSLTENNIFFIPDGNLARNVAKEVPDKNIIANDGYCPVHHNITAKKLLSINDKYPEGYILVHPECREEVVELADYVGSTSGIIKEAGNVDTDKYIIVTEEGIGWKLKNEYPNKDFIFLDTLICDDMKLVTLDKIINVLKTGDNEVFVKEDVALEAKRPLDKMLELGKQ